MTDRQSKEFREKMSIAMKKAFANGLSDDHKEHIRQGQQRQWSETKAKLALLDQIMAEKASATT